MPNENNTTTAFNEEVRVQHQPINSGPVKGIPSPPDHMRYMKHELCSYHSPSVISENVAHLLNQHALRVGENENVTGVKELH